MAAELVNVATSEKLTEIDWTKNIEICELVASDQRQTKDVIKAIKKRLGSKNGNTQLLAASLLEMLMNNIGEPVHKQIIDNRIIPILVKIVKAKSELPVREKIFLLLDAAQTSVGGASGKFPQYYNAYYELVTAGVKFPHQRAVPISSNGVHDSPPAKEQTVAQPEKIATVMDGPNPPDFSILEKAGTALEVLREVLAAIDTRHPEAAKDEFTLDLVEQCSFHKEKVMQLAMTSRDDNLVSQAIDLNEQLQRVLTKHDALVSIEPTSVSNHLTCDQGHEEEEPEQLFRRLRKGKAHVRPEDEEHPVDRPFGLLSSSVPSEIPHRPLIRPLTVEPKKEAVRPLTVEKKQEDVRRLAVEPKQEDVRPFAVEPKQEAVSKPVVAIPPPPAKHVEREKFFQQKKTDGSSLSGHMRGLSLHSRNASSSGSGSADSSVETFL